MVTCCSSACARRYMNANSLKCAKNPLAKCAEMTLTSSTVNLPSAGVADTFITSRFLKYPSAAVKSTSSSAAIFSSSSARSNSACVCATLKPPSRANDSVFTMKSSFAPARPSVR